jgi:hypothetical protein
MAKHSLPFSWRALLLAPLVIPVPMAALFVFVTGSKNPIAAFGFLTIGYVFTLAVVGCVLLPTLWLVSWLANITAWLTLVIGGLLAVPIFLAWDYSIWSSSGVDSGPPSTTYPQWIAKNWFSPEPLVIISFGVITASAYHLLATRKRERGIERTRARPSHPGE